MPEILIIVIGNDLLIIEVVIDRTDRIGKDERRIEVCARNEPRAYARPSRAHIGGVGREPRAYARQDTRAYARV